MHTFNEIFKMVKGTINAHTYSGCTNSDLLKAATEIYCKQMEVESNAKNTNNVLVIRQSDNEKEAGEASGR